MKIIGIDPSLTGTAWSVGQETGRIATKSLRGVDRLIRIRDEAFSVCEGADLVVLENYSFASTNQAHQMGELGGVLRVRLREAHVPYVVVAPQARAKFGTGKGNAKKDEVVSTVSVRTGVVFNNNDECDAFLLWCMGMEAYGFETPLHPTNNTMWTKHREVLSAIEWPDIVTVISTIDPTDGVVMLTETLTPIHEYVPPKKKTRSD